MRKSCGFTLIELLVVIAIISILATMLIPALKNAQDLAQNSLCMSNLRGCTIANNMYAMEYRDLQVIWVYDKGWGFFMQYDNLIEGQTLMNCPSWEMVENSNYYYTYGTSRFWNTGRGELYLAGSLMNPYSGVLWRTYADGYFRRLTDINEPANYLMFADSMNGALRQSAVLYRSGLGTGRGLGHFRHIQDESINASFIDGHVKSVQQANYRQGCFGGTSISWLDQGVIEYYVGPNPQPVPAD